MARNADFRRRSKSRPASPKTWLAAALSVAHVLFVAGCTSVFFQPAREHFENPLLAQVRVEDVHLVTPDRVRLHGWVLHPRTPAPRRGTLVFFHGNAENISTHASSVVWLAQQGYEAVLFDYRGYGRSEGSPGIDGVHTDAAAVLDWVFSNPDLDRDRVWVLGQSLGGAVAIYTVASSPHKNRVKLLVADSAFAGYRRIAREKMAGVALTWPFQYPLSLLFNDRYSPEKWVSRVSPVPVLVLHGALDAIVPVGHAQVLFEEASEPKGIWIVRDADHIGAFGNADLRSKLLSTLDERVGEGAAQGRGER